MFGVCATHSSRSRFHPYKQGNWDSRPCSKETLRRDCDCTVGSARGPIAIGLVGTSTDSQNSLTSHSSFRNWKRPSWLKKKPVFGWGYFNSWSFLSSLEYPTWYMAWDDRWLVIQARSDFVGESTMVALRPTRLRGIRLKLQDTFAFTQPTSVVMPVGNVGSNAHYRDIVANRDRFPGFH